jgi:4-diphosphocytidyl-2-C-methyl-D-erythritol kinase
VTPAPGWGCPLPAPAKLNLFLRVLGRRADGYHDIQTVFQLLDYGDELVFRPRDDGAVSRSRGADGVAAADDLTVRAARLLQRHTDCRMGADIEVRKRIPVGGGLGGGSSDAATTLVALNALWGLGLPRNDLAALGAELGADVPVFVHGRSAWGEGIGTRLTPVELPPRCYAVVKPPCSVPTAAVFQAPELTRNSPPMTICGFLSAGGGNDCLGVVRERFPEVGEALDWLGRYGEARLTGTGACVFAAFDRLAEAEAVIAALPARYRGFAARGVDRSPLMAALPVTQPRATDGGSESATGV